jgi:hypothetical protein
MCVVPLCVHVVGVCVGRVCDWVGVVWWGVRVCVCAYVCGWCGCGVRVRLRCDGVGLVVVVWVRVCMYVCVVVVVVVCVSVSVCVVVWLVCSDAVWTLLLLAAAVACVGARVLADGD